MHAGLDLALTDTFLVPMRLCRDVVRISSDGRSSGVLTNTQAGSARSVRFKVR